MSRLTFAGIGTTWQVDTPEPISAEVVKQILARVETFDSTYSRFRHDSLVTRVAQRSGAFEFPDDAPALFDLYDRLHALTHGAVTPLVGRSLENLGYGRNYTLELTAPPAPAADWSTAVSRAGTKLTTHTAQLIDVGAAGKGYLADLVGDVLAASGIDEFIVDASGDILARGTDVVRVALEHPFDPSLAIGTVSIHNQSICASGSNRRVWGEGLHHILDGRTGTPTRDVVATWAIAGTALEADGLATALFFVEPDALAHEFTFDCVRLFTDGRTVRSQRFNGELF